MQRSLVFSADGHSLLVQSAEGTVRMQKAPYIQRSRGLHVDAIGPLFENMRCTSTKRKCLFRRAS